MKQIYGWLAAGLMTFALAGCIENGLSSSNRGDTSSQADRMGGYDNMGGGLGLGGQGELSSLADELALTADQKAAIKTALTSLHQRMRTGHHRGERPTFEEMKAIVDEATKLDRKVADKRVFPSIDILRSGTRKEELLVKPDVLKKTYVLRRILSPMGTIDAVEFLLDKMRQTKTNSDFFDSMNA